MVLARGSGGPSRWRTRTTSKSCGKASRRGTLGAGPTPLALRLASMVTARALSRWSAAARHRVATPYEPVALGQQEPARPERRELSALTQVLASDIVAAVPRPVGLERGI